MALTYQRQFVCALGPRNAGLAGRVLLALYDVAGNPVYGPSAAGIAESVSQPGTYLAALSLDTRWSGRLEWTVAGLPGVGALDDYGAGLSSPRCFTCSLGAANSGLAGSVGLTIEDTGGNVLVARQAAGVRESAALPGGYWATVFLDAGWAGLAVWDVTGRYGVQAFEEFGPGVLPALLPPYADPAARPDPGQERPGAPAR